MARVQRVPVVRSEPVKQRETRVQFQNALPEVLNAVPSAIGHRHVHIAVCVYEGPLAGHPDTSLRPGGRSAENAGGLQRGGVERHQPTLIWHDVLPRVPRGVDTPICQSQGRALIVLRGAEGPARTITLPGPRSTPLPSSIRPPRSVTRWKSDRGGHELHVVSQDDAPKVLDVRGSEDQGSPAHPVHRPQADGAEASGQTEIRPACARVPRAGQAARAPSAPMRGGYAGARGGDPGPALPRRWRRGESSPRPRRRPRSRRPPR